MYYTFEFASKAPNYIRHALAVVTVGNGRFVCTLSVDDAATHEGKDDLALHVPGCSVYQHRRMCLCRQVLHVDNRRK